MLRRRRIDTYSVLNWEKLTSKRTSGHERQSQMASWISWTEAIDKKIFLTERGRVARRILNIRQAERVLFKWSRTCHFIIFACDMIHGNLEMFAYDAQNEW